MNSPEHFPCDGNTSTHAGFRAARSPQSSPAPFRICSFTLGIFPSFFHPSQSSFFQHICALPCAFHRSQFESGFALTNSTANPGTRGQRSQQQPLETWNEELWGLWQSLGPLSSASATPLALPPWAGASRCGRRTWGPWQKWWHQKPSPGHHQGHPLWLDGFWKRSMDGDTRKWRLGTL